MSEQTPAVEALAEVIRDSNTGLEYGLTRVACRSVAEAVLASDWLAACEQAAERRGAVKELREAADSALRLRRDGYLARLYHERAHRIEAES